MLNIVFLLVIIAVLALVTAQNATPVVLTIFIWKFEASLSVIIFLSVFAGLLMAAVFIFSGYMRRLIKNKRQAGDQGIGKKMEGGDV